MKEILLKWIDNQRYKYEKLFCRHDWKEMMSWNSSYLTGVTQEKLKIMYVCKKCGEFYKFEL